MKESGVGQRRRRAYQNLQLHRNLNVDTAARFQRLFGRG